ncbi:MAG: energy-coupling factor ABC transporter ATP-binding protein, partial [Bifidobacteriaceae bacterium]|nr:energy-coupling factor ABC transporter ATP-binding protein [Bifidobacteriaceae bacterium]
HQFVTSSVWDEVACGLRLRHLDEAETAARVNALLERFDLASRARLNPFLLSHGEKRRLSVATALVTRPRVLIMDEPTFGQDRARAVQVVALARSLAAEGVAVLLVAHDLQLAADCADRVAVMAEGRLVACGPASEVLLDEPSLRAAGLRPAPLARLAPQLAAAGLLAPGSIRLDDLRRPGGLTGPGSRPGREAAA